MINSIDMFSSWRKTLEIVVRSAAAQIGKYAIMFFLLTSLAACDTKECVDINLGAVPLSVPKQYLTPTTPRQSSNGNFIFPFDSSIPGIDCPVGCKELFVNISHGVIYPVEQRWNFLDPEFTGRTSDEYKIYLSRFDREGSKIRREILVPTDTSSRQDEFYSCHIEGSGPNPLCSTIVVTKSELAAEFSIPRKVLPKMRKAIQFITDSIEQFSENRKKGICK